MTTPFEHQTCTRCGGGGKYSFNQMDGDRCYGCSGTGLKLTKRGAAAKVEYQRLLERPAGEVKVGDSVYDYLSLNGSRVWLKVDSVATSSLNSDIAIELSRKGKPAFTRLTSPAAILCSVTTEAQRLGFLAQALAYQAKLTKVGKPSKRLAA